MTTMLAVQTGVNAFWVLLDFVILFTYFKYGKKEWPKMISPKYFIPWSILVFVMAAQYSAFLQNLLMSVLFISMFMKRGNAKGQSITLAVAKWIGTLAPTISMGIITYNPVVLVCGIFCTVFDVIYIILLVWNKHRNSEREKYLSKH